MNKVIEKKIKGLSISKGIAFGRLLLVQSQEMKTSHSPSKGDQEEVQKYRQAIDSSRKDMQKLSLELEGQQGAMEGVSILETYLSFLEDPLLIEEVEERILSRKMSAEMALLEQLEKISRQSKEIKDLFFQHRYQEMIGDVISRILAHLGVISKQSLKEIREGAILFAQAFSSFDMMEIDPKKISAILTETDGRGSHAAIIARGRGIPFITNIPTKDLLPLEGEQVIVDANGGLVIFFPSVETKARYQKIYLNQLVEKKIQKNSGYLAETIDGYRVHLSANIDTMDDVLDLNNYPIKGIGLFRTELAFSLNKAFPSEEEQTHVYTNLAKKAGNLPVVIRTFDIGADKPGFLTGKEQNPSLGCRAIRFLLKEPKIFKDQLKAILRASLFGEVKILFPMIATFFELLEAKKRVKEAYLELKAENVPIEKIPPLGSMIEVPSAAMIIDLLAQEIDFLSLGTNDLVQYALACDRTNLALDDLYSATHPSVLRLIKWIINEADFHRIPLSVCGEMSRDPKFIPLLLGLGIQELSVPLQDIPLVLDTIRNVNIVDAHTFSQDILKMRFSQEIEAFLNQTNAAAKL